MPRRRDRIPEIVSRNGDPAPPQLPSPAQQPASSNGTSGSKSSIPISSGNQLRQTPPSTGSRRKEAASVAWEAVKTALVILRGSSEWLPPLKAAAGGLVALIDAMEVSEMNFPFSSRWTYRIL
jgi:hypothetical protein